MSNPEINPCGDKMWYNKKGQRHRTDGPAIIWLDGSEFWYKNGQRHRTDGPAIIYPDGRKIWYINGKEVPPIPDHILLWRKKLSLIATRKI